MRKTIATVVFLSLTVIGYTAWPLYDPFELVRAIETRDVDTVTRHVYFDQVRISRAALVRQSRRAEIMPSLADSQTRTELSGEKAYRDVESQN
jgi:hypothetical protein